MVPGHRAADLGCFAARRSHVLVPTITIPARVPILPAERLAQCGDVRVTEAVVATERTGLEVGPAGVWVALAVGVAEGVKLRYQNLFPVSTCWFKGASMEYSIQVRVCTVPLTLVAPAGVYPASDEGDRMM